MQYHLLLRRAFRRPPSVAIPIISLRVLYASPLKRQQRSMSWFGLLDVLGGVL